MEDLQQCSVQLSGVTEVICCWKLNFQQHSNNGLEFSKCCWKQRGKDKYKIKSNSKLYLSLSNYLQINLIHGFKAIYIYKSESCVKKVNLAGSHFPATNVVPLKYKKT